MYLEYCAGDELAAAPGRKNWPPHGNFDGEDHEWKKKKSSIGDNDRYYLLSKSKEIDVQEDLDKEIENKKD